MTRPLRIAVRDRLSLRSGLYAVGLLVLFRVVFEMAWETVGVLAAIALFTESFDVASAVPDLDERYLLFVFSLFPIGIGAVLLRTGDDPVLGGAAVATGGWLLLDTVYNLRTGHHPGSSDEDIKATDAMLLMQVGNLVADELQDGPKTVPELAAACDMTESRVRDALAFHERAGTAYEDDGEWHLDDSKIGPWAFVRDNAIRIGGRLVRPFRLFVPS
ncbi:hypothetical protein ACFR9U_19710 [Halorientalis brevis]|uniref:Uncharacterized protein n=1 Tax=Halorientalis brevis TaxID=1126241 RepID=A0ABD6CI10_9EURY|nr:hypothetical protein [Halorientalis brevis]